MDKIILTENIENNDNKKRIINPIIDGFHVTKMLEHLKNTNGEDVANSNFKNAIKCLNYYSNPNYTCEYDFNNLTKILCLGKVQSGKTGFFITAISLAFDNAYDIAYLIGGTKNTLKDQNYNRITSEFKNNNKVVILDINSISENDIFTTLQKKCKVILVCLKNSAEKANLGKALSLASALKSIPSIVIDDEGDEYTPGAPNLKKKKPNAGVCHDLIVDILKTLNNVTYLSVTATPQANLLLSTIDEISPDYAVLVEPGKTYTGGNAFHDVIDNSHVIQIDDSDDFKKGVPLSFKNALYYFIFCACLTRANCNYMPLSMLVHPSHMTRIQNDLLFKIQSLLETSIKELSTSDTLFSREIYNKILAQKFEYMKTNYINNLDVTDKQILDEIPKVAREIFPFVFNVSKIGREDVEREKNDKHLYKIYVGGNMLGRGLTIKNLIVTYMYRDSKVHAIDTLYQRARWLGYKASYFDLCRVYMTRTLIETFVSIVDNENAMWESFNNFLKTNIDIKKLNRVFTITGDQNIILTRVTVSKTIKLECINEGFKYDKSMTFKEDERIINRMTYLNFIENNKYNLDEIKYSEHQTHLYIKLKFTQFIDQFLNKYIFPKASKFSLLYFDRVLEQIKNDVVDDTVTVIVMRYKTGEYRTVNNISTMSFVGELLQSYDNKTGYPGDKNLPEFNGQHYFQIHLVYSDKSHPEDYVPLLCYNNPISKKTIKFVTGENYV